MFRPGAVVGAVAVLALSCDSTTGADLCADVRCGEGRCVVVDSLPACWCHVGFQASGLVCEPSPPVDLCASRPCAGLTNALCLVSDGAVRCECAESRIELGGACVLRTPCTPNPCTSLNRTTCEVVGSAANCLCDPGYAPTGAGCSAAPVWDCDQQHGEGDAAEPDECPPLASPLAPGVSAARTLSPAGDHDWFRLSVTPGRLYAFAATAPNPTPLLLVEVYDEAGTTLLASDNRGSSSAAVAFPAETVSLVQVRVRGVRATDVGTYAVQYVELGTDDYANDPALAITLAPGAAGFSGEVQYAGDPDVIWLEVPPLTAVRLGMDDGGASDVVVSVERLDGGSRQLGTGESTVVAVPAVERLMLTAHGRTPRALGPFSLQLSSLGPDDHSDEAAFATPLAGGAGPRAGVLERDGDADTFGVEQVAGHLYQVTWQGVMGLAGSVLDADGRVIDSAENVSAAPAGLVWKAPQARRATVRLKAGAGAVAPYLYTVAVEDLGLDDHGDLLSSATPTALGTPTSGRLELRGDVDTFSFTAAAGRIVQATASTPTSAPVRVRVYSPQGVLLAEANDTTSTLVESAAVYKVQVSRPVAIPGAADLLAYTLTMNELGSDDHEGTSTGASAIALATPTAGSVQYGADVDVFAFAADPNHLYEVRCVRAAGSVCSFQVKDPSGILRGSPSAATGVTTVVHGPTAGRWTIEVNGGPSSSPTLGPYTLTVTDLGLEDHGSAPATATPVPIGSSVSGGLSFEGDVDVFSFPVVAGHIYAAMEQPHLGPLEVRDSTGNVLATASYGGTALFLASVSETVYAVVAQRLAFGGYTLTVEDRGADDHSNGPQGATPATLGVSTAGALQYQGDLDYFSAPVTAGHHHLVSCAPSSGECSVRVEAGTSVLAYSSVIPTVSFKPPAGVSDVHVRVSSSISDTARYAMTVTDIGADDHGDTRVDGTPLVLDATATLGVLETTTDVDAFTLSTPPGQVVALTCTTASGLACGVRLLDPYGALVFQANPGPLVRTGYLSTNGSWLVEVRTNIGSSFGSSYTLVATRGNDDVPAPTPLAEGTPRSGTIDYLGDTDVFTLPLTAGTPVDITVTAGARVKVTPPQGGTSVTISGGYVRSYTPTTTGTFTLTVEPETPGTALVAYTLTVQ